MMNILLIAIISLVCHAGSSIADPVEMPDFVSDGHKIVDEGISSYMALFNKQPSQHGRTPCSTFDQFFRELKEGEVRHAINVLALLDEAIQVAHPYKLPVGGELIRACETIDDQVNYYERKVDKYLDQLNSFGSVSNPDRSELHKCSIFQNLLGAMKVCERELVDKAAWIRN